MALGMGDLGLAGQAWRVTLGLDAGHCEAATNLGVLAARQGRREQVRAGCLVQCGRMQRSGEATVMAHWLHVLPLLLAAPDAVACTAPIQARSLYRTAQRLSAGAHEPWYNAALLAWRQGDLQATHEALEGALAAFPGHADSQELARQLRAQLVAVQS